MVDAFNTGLAQLKADGTLDKLVLKYWANNLAPFFMNPSPKRRPGWLQLQANNLVLLASAPLLVYLFATSTNYSRSLAFIVGVEEGAAIFQIFLVLLLGLLSGLIPIFLIARPVGFLSSSSLLVGTGAAPIADVLAPHDGIWRLSGIGDWRPAGCSTTHSEIPESIIQSLLGGTGLDAGMAGNSAVALPSWNDPVVVALTNGTRHLNRWIWRLLLVLQGGSLLFLILVARLSFATGLLLTLRAAISFVASVSLDWF